LLASAIPEATAPAAAPFAGLVAISAKHRTVATRLERYGCGLATSRTNHRGTLRWSRTVTGAPTTLIVFLCLTASLAALWCRITTFLKERLISSCEGEVLPAVTARKLYISGHGSPRGDCTAQRQVCVKSYDNCNKFIVGKSLLPFPILPNELCRLCPNRRSHRKPRPLVSSQAGKRIAHAGPQHDAAYPRIRG
jgi:hypothetical protein